MQCAKLFYILSMALALVGGGALKSVPLSSSILGVSEKTSLRSDDIFKKAIASPEANTAQVKTIDGVFLFNITSGGKVAKKWTFDFKNAKYYQGPAHNVKVDTSFTVSDADMIRISLSKLKVKVAYLMGKLKISGNYGLALKFGHILQQHKSKL